MSKPKVILKVAPCPRCGSWHTDCIDEKKLLYQCRHINCLFMFFLKNHHGLIFYKDGSVKRVGKPAKEN